MGERVMLDGLTVQADLNGTMGFAVGWDEQRYSVVIEKEAVVALVVVPAPHARIRPSPHSRLSRLPRLALAPHSHQVRIGVLPANLRRCASADGTDEPHAEMVSQGKVEDLQAILNGSPLSSRVWIRASSSPARPHTMACHLLSLPYLSIGLTP
jgi:hypothetical protein